MLNIIKYLGGGSKVPKVYVHNKNQKTYLLLIEKLVDNLEGPIPKAYGAPNIEFMFAIVFHIQL